MTSSTISAILASVPTASELREQLEGMGIHEPALGWAVKAHAPKRHRVRTEAAKVAALEEAARLLPEARDLQRKVLALVLIWTEMLGEGGPADLGGPDAGTARLPWACGLGKGRRLASDGEAWSAAITAAGDSLSENLRGETGVWTIKVQPTTNGQKLAVSVRDQNEFLVSTFEVPLPPPRTAGLVGRLARRAIAPAVGLEVPNLPFYFAVSVELTGSAADWSTCWTWVHQAAPYEVGACWEAEQASRGIDVGSGDDPVGAMAAREAGRRLGYEEDGGLASFIKGATEQYQSECASK